MAKKKTKSDPYAPYRRQATDAADLRYGQEIDALRLLQDSARGTYVQGRAQANSAAESIIAAANSSQPKLADLMSRVGQYSGETTARLAPAAGSGLSREASVQANNLGLTAQSALSQLEKEKTRAAQAGAFQGQKLADDYRSDLGKIQDRGQSLSKEYGLFAQDTLGKLLEAKADRTLEYEKIRQDAKTSTAKTLADLMRAGYDKDGGVIKGGAADPDAAASAAGKKAAAVAAAEAPYKPAKKPTSGAGSASPASRDKFVSAFEKAQPLASKGAQRINAGSKTPDQILDFIENGSAATVYVPALDAKGNKVIDPLTGQPKMVAQTTKVKGNGNTLAARAALEVKLHGGISSDTAKALHRVGLSAKDLGQKVIPQRVIQARVEARKRRIRVGTSAAGNHPRT